jgi:predicted amidophosphoribosyltransferase
MEEKTTTTCSKCHEALDTAGYPRWCRRCRAKYKREYEETRDRQADVQAYLRGAAAFKADVLAVLRSKPAAGLLTIGDFARWLSEHPAPDYTPAITEIESPPVA